MIIQALITLLVLLAINFATYMLFARDKKAAKKRIWRVSEKSLFFMAIIGGSPAALYAMNKLRHKTKKTSFLYTIYFIVFMQLVLVLYAFVDKLILR